LFTGDKKSRPISRILSCYC